MGSTVKKVATVVNPVGYAVNSFIGNQAHNTLNNPLDPLGNLKKSAGTLTSDFRQAGNGLGILPNNPNNPASYGPLDIYMNPTADAQQITSLGGSFAGQDRALGQEQNNSLTGFGDTQSGQTNNFINQDAATRATNRQQLAQLLQDQAAQSFKQTLPGTAEDYNAGGLLNSTGYQQEVARQQGQLAAGITNQLGQQGLQDSNYTQQLKLAALQQNQGYQAQGENALLGGMTNANSATQTSAQNALSRQFSLQDYARQANVAQQIGAKTLPNQASGKGGAVNAGATGAGAGLSIGGPLGGAIGGLAGFGLGGGK